MAGSLAGKTIIAHSRMVGASLAAAETLEGEGVSVEVLDLRSIAPWDREMVIASVSRTGRAVIAHEAVREHGIGAEMLRRLAAHCAGGSRRRSSAWAPHSVRCPSRSRSRPATRPIEATSPTLRKAS